MRKLVHFALVAMVLALGACASTGTTAAGAARRGNTNLLTQEQIRATNYTNAYEVVQALRSNWLRTRGPDTIMGQQGQVLVYLDDSKLGGVEQLRAINTAHIDHIRYYDGIAASGRWGLDHGHGVIYVSTRPS